MKLKSIIALAGLILLSSFTTKLHDGGNALCKAYFPVDKGTVLKYEHYNGKDKLEGYDLFEVKDLVTEGAKLTINVHASSFNKKDKETYDNEFSFSCENGIFTMSMEAIVPSSNMEGMKDMEVEITQKQLVFPTDLSVGQTLPDAEMIMSTGGMEMMRFNVVNRKVEAIETIETPAGSFECYKISSTTKSKIAFMKIEASSIDWIKQDIGNVRSESYDKSGKLTSYSVLSEIKR